MIALRTEKSRLVGTMRRPVVRSGMLYIKRYGRDGGEFDCIAAFLCHTNILNPKAITIRYSISLVNAKCCPYSKLCV